MYRVQLSVVEQCAEDGRLRMEVFHIGVFSAFWVRVQRILRMGTRPDATDVPTAISYYETSLQYNDHTCQSEIHFQLGNIYSEEIEY